MKIIIMGFIISIITTNLYGFDLSKFEFLVYITRELMDIPYKKHKTIPDKNGFKKYKMYIYEASKRYSIDPFLIHTIILYESNYNPYAVSCKGAKGLMQLMPETAIEMGVRNIFNPRENILGGTKYFRILLNRFNGNYYKALVAYNAGPDALKKHKIPLESRIYAKKILLRWKQYKRR